MLEDLKSNEKEIKLIRLCRLFKYYWNEEVIIESDAI